MEIQEQIDEIFEYLKEDCGYYAITGTIFRSEITENFQHQKVEGGEFSFDHVYFHQTGSPAIEDYYTGTTLIPIGKDVYAVCEWNS